jgi:hypothetical protein
MGRVRNYISRVTHVVGDVGRRINPELKRVGLLCLLVVGVLLIAMATVQTPLKDLLPDFFDYLGVVVLICIALLEWAEEKSWFRRTLFVLIVVSGGLSLGSVYVT